MCQDIQQVTFACGHQTKFWWLKSRFCLFTGTENDCFHTTYLSYKQNGGKCARCKIGQMIRGNGKAMKREDFRQEVEAQYARTVDFAQEANAKKFESEAADYRRDLTEDRIAELQLQIKERIQFYLEADTMKPGGKIVLLRTILSLSEIFARKELVTLFGSRYFPKGDKKRKLERSEKNKLFSIARKAGFERTLQASL